MSNKRNKSDAPDLEIYNEVQNDSSSHELSDSRVNLLGKPSDLLDMLIKDKKEKMWAIDFLVKERPKYKQVLSTLLVKRLYLLVNEKEKFSINKLSTQNESESTKSSEHEAIVYAMCIQLIEWAISASSNK